MIAVSEYQTTYGDFNQYIDKRIENAIINTINNEINSDRIGHPSARQPMMTGDISRVPKRVFSSRTTGTLLSRTDIFFIMS